jgi:hypothetical protein
VKLNDDPKASIFGFTTRLPAISLTRAGLPIASFFGYVIEGVLKNDAEAAAATQIPGYTRAGVFKFKDVSGPDGVPDGKINASDRTVIGNPHPDFTYGLNLNLGYKNWDFTVFAQGVQGNEIFNYLKYWTDFNTFQGNRSKDMLYNSWKKQGDVALLPRLNAGDTFSQQISTYFVEDGSYMRITNVHLTYTVPTNVLKTIQLSSMQIYVQGQNLLTLTKYKGLDPEVNGGIDNNFYPRPRTFVLGLNLNF